MQHVRGSVKMAKPFPFIASSDAHPEPVKARSQSGIGEQQSIAGHVARLNRVSLGSSAATDRRSINRKDRQEKSEIPNRTVPPHSHAHAKVGIGWDQFPRKTFKLEGEKFHLHVEIFSGPRHTYHIIDFRVPVHGPHQVLANTGLGGADGFYAALIENHH
jgi:hypothetical protein